MKSKTTIDKRYENRGQDNFGAERRSRGWNLLIAIALLPILFLGLPAVSHAASWTPLTNLAPNFTGTMLLLSDGSVMVQVGGVTAQWMRLTPDIHGSYVNGTWAQNINPMSTPRLYFASEVLPSGKVWVLGGEYSGTSGAQNITNTGEIWDPLTNTWSPIAPYPNSYFGDDPSILIPGGKILAGDLFTPVPHIYDIASNTWSTAGAKLFGDPSDEEGYLKLPNGNILNYSLFASISANTGLAQVYNPTTNSWVSASNGTLPVLSSAAVGFELGPLLRLQDGRVIVIGANQHTALYNPSTDTWAAGPDNPDGFGSDDAPAAILPNGHVIFAADAGPVTGVFSPPTRIYDFNPTTNTISAVSPALPDGNLPGIPAFITRMLILPTGQLLFADSSRRLWVYTADGVPNPAARPVVNGVTYNGGGLFTLTGKQLNGQSAGSSYGDDVETDENYPIVRMTSSTGNVYYARTTNWSTVGVDGGVALQNVNFTLNPAMPAGNYSLVVTGAGISSFPIFLNITQAQVNGL